MAVERISALCLLASLGKVKVIQSAQVQLYIKHGLRIMQFYPRAQDVKLSLPDFFSRGIRYLGIQLEEIKRLQMRSFE